MNLGTYAYLQTRGIKCIDNKLYTVKKKKKKKYLGLAQKILSISKIALTSRGLIIHVFYLIQDISESPLYYTFCIVSKFCSS